MGEVYNYFLIIMVNIKDGIAIPIKYVAQVVDPDMDVFEFWNEPENRSQIRQILPSFLQEFPIVEIIRIDGVIHIQEGMRHAVVSF